MTRSAYPCLPLRSWATSGSCCWLESQSRRALHEVSKLILGSETDTHSCPRVGLVLSRYKSGPLPKPFKIVPSLPAWARMLALTHPENWSPQACHAATRIFVSQMKPNQARVFLEGVLLDAIREDIRLTKEGQRKQKNNRKLNVHYYESLKRALYKPAAFFKGIVFPLLQVSL